MCIRSGLSALILSTYVLGGSGCTETPVPESGEPTATTTGDESVETTAVTSTSEVRTSVRIEGQVIDYDPLLPEEVGIEGAEITIRDLDGVAAKSMKEGAYAFSDVPMNQELTVEIAPSEDFLGLLVALNTGEEDMLDHTLSQVSRSFVDSQLNFLVTERADFDENTGIVIARLLQNTAAGEGVRVSMSPAPAENTYYSPDAIGIPELNSDAVLNSIFPVVVFYNLDPSAAGELKLEAIHPDRRCVVVRPDFPVMASTVTLVDIDCPPVE